ncbi:META domain-containing protein [Hymenobacter sp. BRD128]|uniref:META domain-containing protein n=1 Tax=Hymenobacter sp. BRD128 TaxID=2675878 RepID=UPI001565B9E2|nr:META domain-containing protein [Hymenobacter sp. BRD128]QKG57115.1 META domain-containing protein [Hymenobacter sp. BRD128]
MKYPAFLLPCILLTGAACQRVTERSATTPMATSITPDASLRETRWVLRQVGSQPVAEVASPNQTPYLFISAAGTAEGLGGCNRFRGALKPATDDGELQFAPLQSTRMTCPELETEQAFAQALENTHAYRITGKLLLLYADAGRTGTPLAQLEAVPLP